MVPILSVIKVTKQIVKCYDDLIYTHLIVKKDMAALKTGTC